MTRPALPPLVEQTRVLLLTQMWLLLVGILIFLLLLEPMSARLPSQGEAGSDFAVLLLTLLGTPVPLALAAKLVRHGWAFGWVFALLAEAAVAFHFYAAFAFGLFFGAAMLVFALLAVWVTVNLFRPDVRRFFFARNRVTARDSVSTD